MRSDAPRRPERSFTLPDRYRLRRHIASGGMASVWCADDLVLDRSVAIKVLAERFAHDGLAVARFKREARAAARVSGHPHVVTVYDVGELPSDEAAIDTTHSTDRGFIVMEHLAGGTVADAIRHDSVRRHEAMRWLHEAASALDHAHANGIVHRDIKPANFLLDRARVLHVADFGIARLTTEETITSSDQLFGTAAYLSPEQALGREATGASDRYALAVCAFELLAGERPFSAPHFSAQARQHIEEPPPAASEIDRSLPPAVDEVLFAGLAKDPAARPQTAGEFVGALADALAGRWPENLSGAGPRGARGERANFSTGRRGASRSPDPAAPAASTAAARRHNDTRSPATRGPSSAHARRTPSRARLLALGMVAVAVLVLAGIAAAALGGHGNANTRLADAHTPTTHSTASRTATRASTTHHRTAPARTSTSRTASTPAAQTASQLETTGHAEMLNGDYTSAISTLKQAVSTAPTDSLTYAYALYDLGRSELEAGEPQAAIAILRQRLKIPNQRGVVKALLDQAIATANAPATSDPTPTTPTTTNAAPPANAGTPGGSGSGGGGLGNGGTPPGQAKKWAGDSRGGRGRGLVRIITAAVGS